MSSAIDQLNMASEGKGSYVSLSMDDLKESNCSEKDDEKEDRKSEITREEETRSVVDEFLDEFNEVFRRKVSLVNLIKVLIRI